MIVEHKRYSAVDRSAMNGFFGATYAAKEVFRSTKEQFPAAVEIRGRMDRQTDEFVVEVRLPTVLRIRGTA